MHHSGKENVLAFRQMAKLGHSFSITEERLVLLFVGRTGMGNVWLAAGESEGGGDFHGKLGILVMSLWGKNQGIFLISVSVRKHSKK